MPSVGGAFTPQCLQWAMERAGHGDVSAAGALLIASMSLDSGAELEAFHLWSPSLGDRFPNVCGFTVDAGGRRQQRQVLRVRTVSQHNWPWVEMGRRAAPLSERHLPMLCPELPGGAAVSGGPPPAHSPPEGSAGAGAGPADAGCEAEAWLPLNSRTSPHLLLQNEL